MPPHFDPPNQQDELDEATNRRADTNTNVIIALINKVNALTKSDLQRSKFFVEIKDTTGDYTVSDSWNGRLVLNTSDGNLKILENGVWKLLATEFTELTDTPSAYTGSAGDWAQVNAGETALQFSSTLQKDLNFAEFKSVAMVVDNGAILPATPTKGQWFLHTPTGRDCLLMYDGSNWTPIISLGSVTLFVDVTDGTDDPDLGTGTGVDAFETIQFAIDTLPGLIGGNVQINVASGNYVGDNVFQGKNLTGNFTITIQGELSSQEDIATATVAAGTGATQGTITKVGAFAGDSYANLLVYFVTDDEYRVIDSHTDDVLTLVGTAPSSTAQDVTIFSWGTSINSGVNGITITGDQKSIFVKDIEITGTSDENTEISEYGSGNFQRCRIISSATFALRVGSISNCNVLHCYIECDDTHGIDIANLCFTEVAASKLRSISGTRNSFRVRKNSSGVVTSGTIIDNWANGVQIVALAQCGFSSSAANGYPRIRNNTTGVLATDGGVGLNTPNNQYSGNATDENPSGASDPAFID